MHIRFVLTAGALALTLSACGAPQRGPSDRVIARALQSAPGAAQPSTIVKTEIAYARTAKEQGQYSAGTLFAGPGAQLHGRSGPVDAVQLFTSLSEPDQANDWSPSAVVMSCDGQIALSMGRFQDAEGFVGNYVTTWRREQGGDYKWIYDVAGRDDPQPPPRREFEDGDIVVTAIDSVEGLVATCPRAGEVVPPPPPLPIGADNPGRAELSRDGTLRWRWEHRADGTKFVAADYYYLGEWVTAIEESLASPDEG